MTLHVGVSGPDWALAAADTRELVPEAGRWQAIDRPGKLTRLRHGWASSGNAGESFPLWRRTLARIAAHRSPGEVGEIVESVRDAHSGIESVDGGEGTRFLIATAGLEGTEYVAHAVRVEMDTRGELTISTSGGPQSASWGLPVDRAQEQEEVREGLGLLARARSAAGEGGIAASVRGIALMALGTRQVTDAISETIELGVTWTPERHDGPVQSYTSVDAHEAREADPTWLARRFEEGESIQLEEPCTREI